MNSFQIVTVHDVYRFVEHLKSECQKNGMLELYGQLDDDLHLGSSGLEVLGALRQTLINNSLTIEQLLGPAGNEWTDQIIAFVDKTFGR